MSRKELDHAVINRHVVEKTLKQSQAADQMDISDRQLRRILKSFHTDGATTHQPKYKYRKSWIPAQKRTGITG